MYKEYKCTRVKCGQFLFYIFCHLVYKEHYSKFIRYASTSSIIKQGLEGSAPEDVLFYPGAMID